ncbi:DUF6875 domain-containing protein [Streptomyces sp. NPDC014734]|uniref:DUF6875 domain-containing protein n=1 Tax=Streptomyces sp. NPDC014734 TaxID=3364886 RepID=UPI0036F4C0FE
MPVWGAALVMNAMESQSDIVGETSAWLRSFLTRPHADLGRKGAVCPFMEQSLKLGRAALSSVDVSGPRGRRRLETTARSALARLGEDSGGDNVYNSFVMVPVGPDEATRAALVVDVQQTLKAEAVAAGKMVGEFFPGHPMPGIHNASFRPLASPHPLLAVRAMVITDILFLVFPSIPPADRLANLEVWHGRFGDSPIAPWAQLYETSRAEAERELRAQQEQGSGATAAEGNRSQAGEDVRARV